MAIKFLPHTADIKFQASGPTLEKAFEESAKAMFQSMCKDKIAKKIKKQISVKGTDKENLLYNFLEELLFLLDTEGFLKNNKKKKLKKQRIFKKNKKDTMRGGGGGTFSLTADLHGDDVSKYPANLDVKAITYNQMFVKKQGDKFICQVVLDV